MQTCPVLEKYFLIFCHTKTTTFYAYQWDFYTTDESKVAHNAANQMLMDTWLS